MNLHGVPRMTMDVDLMITMDAGNIEKFINVAQDLQLQPVCTAT